MIIYGESDDIICIDSQEYSDEFDAYDCVTTIKFSDGTEVNVDYVDDGIWNIIPLKTGKSFLKIIIAPGDDHSHDPPHDNLPSYSDILFMKDDQLKIRVINKYTNH